MKYKKNNSIIKSIKKIKKKENLLIKFNDLINKQLIA